VSSSAEQNSRHTAYEDTAIDAASINVYYRVTNAACSGIHIETSIRSTKSHTEFHKFLRVMPLNPTD